MKDRKFRNLENGKIYSAYEQGLDGYLELWREAKRLGDIGKDSADFYEPIIPKKEELIEIGAAYFENDEEYEEIKRITGFMGRVGKNMPDKRSYPLRKVVERGRNDAWDFSKDYLECGHILPTPVDIIGERYPEKRRCHKCAKGKEPDFDVKLIKN